MVTLGVRHLDTEGVAMRHRQKREPLAPAANRTYLDSGLRAAVRRVEQRRAERRAETPFGQTLAAALLRRGRTAGLLGRGARQTIVQISVAPRVAEQAMWVTGARSLRELVIVGLVRLILAHRSTRPRFADRRPARRALRKTRPQRRGAM